MSAPWLVTGATGSIGPAIVDELLTAPVDVRVLARRPLDADLGHRWREARRAGRLQVVAGDVRDDQAVDRAVAGCGFVVHAAGAAHHRPSDEAAAAVMRAVNVDGSRVVAVAAARHRVAHTLMVSSAAVYGPGVAGELRDESAPTDPTSVYGRSKLDGERAMRDVLGDGVTVVRPSAVYGPRLDGQYRLLARAVTSPWPIPIPGGDGHCLVTDRDLAVVLRRLAEVEVGGVWNVSDGATYSVGEIVAAIRDATGVARWRAPVASRGVGRGARAALRVIGGDRSSRRERVRVRLGSLVVGPALDSSAVRHRLPDVEFADLASAWLRWARANSSPRSSRLG